jgi:hypothetical protein
VQLTCERLIAAEAGGDQVLKLLLFCVIMSVEGSTAMTQAANGRPRPSGLQLSDSDRLLSLIDRGQEDAFQRTLMEGRLSLDSDILSLALRESARKGLRPIVAALLDYGIAADSNPSNEETALMLAAEAGHSEVVQLLLRSGARVNAITAYGWSALFFAAARDHYEASRLLVEAEADVTHKDIEGRTALYYARRRPVCVHIPIWGARLEGRVLRFRHTRLSLMLKRSQKM